MTATTLRILGLGRTSTFLVASLAIGGCGDDRPVGPTSPPAPPPTVFAINASANPPNGGAISGGGDVREGRTVTLTAQAYAGYDFAGWIENGVVVSSSLTLTFPAARDRDLAASFDVNSDKGKWSPGGTFSDWFFPAGGYESLEWTFIPVADPPGSLAQKGLLHFYAYTFALTNSNPSVGRGYAGFQTNGIFNGAQKGKVVNFSIWASNGGKSDGLVNPGNTESGGYQIMYQYDWTEGQAYRFEPREGPSGIDAAGKWWGLWVTDLAAGVATFLGEQRVVATIDGGDSSLMDSHTAAFGEDLHWWRSLTGVQSFVCSDFEASAMAVADVTAEGGTVRPQSFSNFTNSGADHTGSNGYQTASCAVTMYANEVGDIQHNLGFWPDAAPLGVGS